LRKIILALVLSFAGFVTAEDNVVIQYDCIPNYANWGGVTALYKRVVGVTVPPDPKGSSVALAAIEKEKESPVADCAYYSGAIGFVAAQKGLHEAYKPRAWEKIPADRLRGEHPGSWRRAGATVVGGPHEPHL
jgi:putative spermidine/putrescine transport system substrate-binding protein